jgi:hypothetical protein
MGLPGVNIRKNSQNAGTVSPSVVGVAAMIAPCSGGGSALTNVATAWNSPSLAQQAYDAGPLLEFAAYEMDEAELPVVLVKPTTSTAATYGAVTSVLNGSSTFTPTTGSAASIADDYNAVFNAQQSSNMAGPIPQSLAGNVAGVLVYFTAGGALGTPGIQFVTSLDGGNSCTPVQSLGSALTISPVEPVTGADTGVRINLGSSTQIVTAGDYFWFTTVGPRMQSADLIAALAALYVSKQPWDLLLVHGETASGLVATLESWVLTMNASGRFPTVVVNTRFKNQTPGSVETETAYASAITTVLTPCVGLDVCAGVDGGAVVSPLNGITKAMPTSLAIVSVCEQNAIGVDPAWQGAEGEPIDPYDIDGPNLTPSFHDESVTNTLDYPGSTLRASTLRSWYGEDGTFITNAYLLSSPGSDFVYIQHNRTMNAAATAAFKQLGKLCSAGVPLDPKTNLILAPVVLAWEQLITSTINGVVKGQVSGTTFVINNSTPLTGTGAQNVTGTIENKALQYIKTFTVTEEFVNSLS